MSSNKLLFLIVVLSLAVRLFGLNWDQGQHLHPDERFLTMVSSSIKLPSDIYDYFVPQTSTLNPYNNGYNFYVYGTFPLLVTRAVAEVFKLTSYDQIFLVGRVLSAIFDSLTSLLVFFVAFKIFKKTKVALLGALLYAICILPIQQAHFFTVDSFTVFFFILTIFLLISRRPLISGLAFGVTLANKTSVGIVLPMFLPFVFTLNKYSIKNRNTFAKYILEGMATCGLFLIFTFIAFRLFQPYAFDGLFSLSPHFISNINEAHKMITGEIDYPPNIQWLSTTPVIHPLINMFFVGFGPVTFLLILLGIVMVFKDRRLIKRSGVILIILISLTIFLYHSFQLAKYMRYFYPVYPVFMIIAGYGLSRLKPKWNFPIIFLNLIITISFLGLYLQAHSRFQASEWICNNIPTSMILSSESWDDSLPLGSPSCSNLSYIHQDLALYDPESPQKWDKINTQLKLIDYLVLSSNRLWGSIPNVPGRYPDTSIFYKNLFDGGNNFKLVKRIYSYPGFSLPFLHDCLLIGPTIYPSTQNNYFEIDKSCDFPGIYFRDDAFEESFTVYDHPQVLIYAKIK
jgi:hypothetical protein